MSTLTVTAKGQVTLKKDILAHLGVQPGDKITVSTLPNGRIEARADRPRGEISELFDSLKRPGQAALTLEELSEIAASGWRGAR